MPLSPKFTIHTTAVFLGQNKVSIQYYQARRLIQKIYFIEIRRGLITKVEFVVGHTKQV